MQSEMSKGFSLSLSNTVIYQERTDGRLTFRHYNNSKKSFRKNHFSSCVKELAKIRLHYAIRQNKWRDSGSCDYKKGTRSYSVVNETRNDSSVLIT